MFANDFFRQSCICHSSLTCWFIWSIILYSFPMNSLATKTKFDRYWVRRLSGSHFRKYFRPFFVRTSAARKSRLASCVVFTVVKAAEGGSTVEWNSTTSLPIHWIFSLLPAMNNIFFKQFILNRVKVGQFEYSKSQFVCPQSSIKTNFKSIKLFTCLKLWDTVHLSQTLWIRDIFFRCIQYFRRSPQC